MSYTDPQEIPITAFDEVLVAVPTPRVQIQAVHGITSQEEPFLSGTGAVDTVDGEFKVSTGTTVFSFAALLSTRGLRYKPGQGADAKFTCRFTSPVASSTQNAGMINIGNRLVFGYSGTVFGVSHNHGGYSELRLLTATTASTSATDATITVDDTPYTVPLTASGIINTTAAEIAESLNSQDALNSYTANQDKVTIRFGQIGPRTGVFSFIHSTAVASFSTIKTGVDPTIDFIPQASWNIDAMNGSGPSGVTMGSDGGEDLDPIGGGFIARICFQYLGYGNILYSIADPENIGKFYPVHVIRWLKDGNIGTNMSDPGYRVGWVTSSLGSTTDLIVHGGSAQLANQGDYVILEESRSKSVELLAASSGSEHHVLTVRNRTDFGGVSNGSEIIAILVKYGTESTKGTVFNIYKNVGSWSTNLIFSYVDETSSIAEISTTTATLSALGSGRLADTGIKLSAGEGSIDLDLLRTVINQAETISITAEISSGAASDLNASITWKEDI